MFEFFRGKLVYAAPQKAVVDVGHTGYSIQISPKTYEKLPGLQSEIVLYVALIIREDEHSLYGFLSVEEKNLFYQLMEVSGIGPKTALTILGRIDVTDLQLAIMEGNSLLLSKMPGIGKKTAERLIIELKDKFLSLPRPSQVPSGTSKNPSVVSDAISALIHLGYHALEAQKRVKKVQDTHAEQLSLSDLITLALKIN